ncbi:MAG TPA: type II toxin-antitoxin system RelE/ParE family toxin [Caulobacteraceae bacterium]|jgi:plasmid stabilization system protein ParE|nr:type II toxin-antitoxin system RelE/ParE family toxin [Caulobacteraceae bacterium]
MRVRFTAAAEAELADARDWYEANAPRAVGRFLDEFEALTRRLAENPQQFPPVDGEARRAGFRRFPYGLFFRIGANGVEVFACFHASRDPRRWQDRA